MYRPLRAGVSIINPRVNEPGTLGVILRAADGFLWAVSCYHVMCDGHLGPYVQDDPIYQPAAVADENKIGVTTAGKANRDLDCAAVKLLPGIDAQMAVLGLGALSVITDPEPGMRVVKMGAVSGLTEGVVFQVVDEQVSIRVDATFPVEYVLSAPGDSGSLWLEQGTNHAVALHRGLKTPKTATATAMTSVKVALGLDL